MTDYFLQSSRLGFRIWREGDLDLAVSLWGDPAVTALIDARGALSPEDVAERLTEEMASQRQHGIQYWPMFLLDGGAFVGCCGLRPYKPAERMPEIGIHIRSRYWGRGLGYEAASAVIAYAFATLGVAALFAGHHPANGRSRYLLEQLGFRYTHDEPYEATGLEHPSYELRSDR